jgi:hypothetical protein
VLRRLRSITIARSVGSRERPIQIITWAVVTGAAKVALLAFIAISLMLIIVVRRRRMRAAHEEFLRTDPEELAFRYSRAQLGYEASARGALPCTPLPAWAYRDLNDTNPDDADQH